MEIGAVLDQEDEQATQPDGKVDRVWVDEKQVGQKSEHAEQDSPAFDGEQPQPEGEGQSEDDGRFIARQTCPDAKGDR